MKVERFTVGAFQVNCYLLTDEATGAQALVDTGEGPELVAALQQRSDLQLQCILLTHAHLDHAGALALLQAEWDVPTYLPRKEVPLFQTLPHQGSMFGMPWLDRPAGRVDHLVDEGDTVQLGQTTLRFVSTPGHTPGQGCWCGPEDIIVGDTVFAGSIGRTDFPMSDPAVARESLRHLFTLDPALRVHSGHGPVTTLGRELASNPFLGYLRQERGIQGPPGISW